MKLEKCDICGMESQKSYLVTSLSKEYQSEYVKDVCGDCQRGLTDIIAKINTAFSDIRSSWVKRIIQKLIKKKANDQ